MTQQIIGISMTKEEVSAMITNAVTAARVVPAVGQGKKRLLSQKDVFNEFGIKPRQLEKWRYAGDGPEYVNIGQRVFYERNVLEAWIAAGRVRTSGMTS